MYKFTIIQYTYDTRICYSFWLYSLCAKGGNIASRRPTWYIIQVHHHLNLRPVVYNIYFIYTYTLSCVLCTFFYCRPKQFTYHSHALHVYVYRRNVQVVYTPARSFKTYILFLEKKLFSISYKFCQCTRSLRVSFLLLFI